jgi:hypothetical protein
MKLALARSSENLPLTELLIFPARLVNIGPGDVNDGNEKLILGLLWTIIYHYQVAATFKNAGQAHGKKGGARDLLLEWVRSKIPEYNIQNFNKDWTDGKAICALTNAVAGEPWILPEHNTMLPASKVCLSLFLVEYSGSKTRFPLLPRKRS